MAEIIQGRDNSLIDYEYLMRGAIEAIAATDQEDKNKKSHPYTEEGIVDYVRRQKRWADSNLGRHYGRVMEDFLWFVGQHNMMIDWRSRRFVQNPATQKIPRPVINIVLEKVESITGKIARAIPSGHINPNSDNVVDRLGARAGENLREFKWDADHMDDVMFGTFQTAAICGDAFTITDDDADNTAPMELEVEGPDGQPQKVMLPAGDVKTKMLLPLQVFFNPAATSLDDARWVHVHVMHAEDFVHEQWPHIRERIAGDRSADSSSAWQTRLHNLLMHEMSSNAAGRATMAGSGNRDQDPIEDQVVVHQVMFKPDRYYPKGRQFIVAGSKVCMAGPLPYGKILMEHYRYTPVPNSQISLGIVYALKYLVRHIENAVGHATLARKIAAVPMFFTPKGAGGAFNEADLEIKMGGVYKYRADLKGNKPELIQGRHPADAGYIADINLMLSEFVERVTGDKSVLAGDAPQGVRAGVALRQLTQSASVRFAPKLSAAIRHVERCESHRLEAVAQSPAWTLPRLIHFPGRAGRRSFSYFRSADMRDNFQYRIEAGPKDIHDESSLAQLTSDATEMGLVNYQDPKVGGKNRRTALKNLGLDRAGFVEPDTVDREFSEFVLAELQQGRAIPLSPFANFQILLEVLTDYMKTEDYIYRNEYIKSIILEAAFDCQRRIEMLQLAARMQEASRDTGSAMAASVAAKGISQYEPQPPPGMAPLPPAEGEMGAGPAPQPSAQPAQPTGGPASPAPQPAMAGVGA